uniref:UPAR/Ly6 domain-containing protein n=1 Tax=Leptobrachium leishanense TaxID=445787 RepID=A0A8C5QSY0_9ANUR
MNSLLGFVCVLSLLIAKGYALSCIKCVNFMSSSCTGTSVVCLEGAVCGSQYATAKTGSLNAQLIVRSCLPESQCTMDGTITFIDGKTKIGTSCCNTTNCTPTNPSLPADSEEVNGVTCPSCISDDLKTCSTSDYIECTGDEDMCVSQTTKIKGNNAFPAALRGCSTKSVCDLGSLKLSSKDITLKVKFTCTSESKGHSEL